MHKRPEGFGPLPEAWDGEQLEIEPDPAPQAPWACPLSQSEHSSETKARNGFRGLTAKGRRAVRDSAVIMEDRRECLSFWTISLPDDALAPIADGDLWPTFVARLRQLLVRRMRAAGLPDQVVGVVELHPVRSLRERAPLPHIHMVYRSKRHRRRPWLMEPEEHDQLLGQVLAAMGIFPRSLQSASKVEPIRQSVGRYLAKYMTKTAFHGMGDADDELCRTVRDWLQDRSVVCLAAAFPDLACQAFRELHQVLRRLSGLVPRQWWFESECLHRLRLANTLRIPRDFCRWIIEYHADSPWKDAVNVAYLAPADTFAPPIWSLSFTTVERLAWLLALWGQDCEDVEAFNRHDRQHDCLFSWL